VLRNIYPYFKFLKVASLVQLVERRSPKPNVEGSSPSGRVLFHFLYLEKKAKVMYNSLRNREQLK
jgi:hypothetical protein